MHPLLQIAVSPCLSPPPVSSCPVPWIRPSRGVYFAPLAVTCLPFEYAGCSQGTNHFQTYAECMNSCMAAPQPAPGNRQPCDWGLEGNGGVGFCDNQGPPQRKFFRENDARKILFKNNYFAEQLFWCGNGMQLPMDALCDGIPNCPNGEDEANCNGYLMPPAIRQLTDESFHSAITAAENILGKNKL